MQALDLHKIFFSRPAGASIRRRETSARMQAVPLLYRQNTRVSFSASALRQSQTGKILPRKLTASCGTLALTDVVPKSRALSDSDIAQLADHYTPK
jgi:hypothetical protein